MLTVHHLAHSQSERIVWLCEELGLPYELKRYAREPATRLAPESYKVLHPAGTSPVIADGDLVLAESGAVIEYLLAKDPGGSLAVDRSSAEFADYLFWFHFANASFLPNLTSHRMLDNRFTFAMRDRLYRSYAMIEHHLARREFFAGARFTAADIMMTFGLTTMQMDLPGELDDYGAIRAYVARISARPAYRRAMLRADPDLPVPRIGAGAG